MPRLHVIMPVYNEPGTLQMCVQRVIDVPLPDGWRLHIVMIDDHSDATHFAAVESLADSMRGAGHDMELHRHEHNRGKGAALQTGFGIVLHQHPPADDLVVIQDADLEYDPADIPALMEPIVAGRADAAIGTRWGAHRADRGLKRKLHAMGNRALTVLSNLMTGFRVSDMECCYKLLPASVLLRIQPMLTEQRFGIEPQLVAALARIRARVVEVPVRYEPRGTEEGKKIGWVDGVRAVYVIARERCRRTPAPAALLDTEDSSR